MRKTVTTAGLARTVLAAAVLVLIVTGLVTTFGKQHPAPVPSATDHDGLRIGTAVRVTDQHGEDAWTVRVNSARDYTPNPNSDQPVPGMHDVVINVTYHLISGSVWPGPTDWASQGTHPFPDGLPTRDADPNADTSTALSNPVNRARAVQMVPGDTLTGDVYLTVQDGPGSKAIYTSATSFSPTDSWALPAGSTA